MIKEERRRKKRRKIGLYILLILILHYRSGRFHCHECFYRGKRCRGGK